jgi:hypothetical protein
MSADVCRRGCFPETSIPASIPVGQVANRLATCGRLSIGPAAKSLAGFRIKLRVRAAALDIAVRQQILRVLVNLKTAVDGL